MIDLFGDRGSTWGVTFFDTAEVYGPFVNEELARAKRSRRCAIRSSSRPNSASVRR